MKTLLSPIFFAICTIAAWGQTQAPGPVNLDILVKGLSDPFLADVPELTQQVQRRGVDFDLGKQLAAILRLKFSQYRRRLSMKHSRSFGRLRFVSALS